jgi:hypothetical protein
MTTIEQVVDPTRRTPSRGVGYGDRTERRMPTAKGSTLRATLAFVDSAAGEERTQAVLARLEPELREHVTAVQATDEVPIGELLALWHAVDAELGAESPQWIEHSGALSIEAFGVQLYGGILRKASPMEFLTQSVSLFRLYYAPGDMHVVEAETGRAVLRLVGFDVFDPLFCRRQTGGLGRALVLAGGTSPSVRHVRCTGEGDAFCEWELKWSAPS